ncbi:MAG: hypothetical protein KatS3mg077_1780 [Candidatus Binatia bacterium]|nr:MAG: hypothetical protein KatS3mg077_1780 [Candidatus Binatia bacterium]
MCLALLGALAGCGSDGDPSTSSVVPIPEPPPGCNPLAPEFDCLLPFPSNVFTVADGEYPSGRRVAIPDSALPHDIHDRPFDPSRVHVADGFSMGTQILALLGDAVDLANLATYDPSDPGRLLRSLAPSSPTVILDADTGERVFHLVDLDPRATNDARRAIVLRPLVRLAPRHRYIVALRRLTDPSGRPLPAPSGFRQLRDRTITDQVLAALAPYYESAIFPALARAGVDRRELQLAWDFTVESEEHVTRDLLAMRDDALNRFAASPPPVTITKVEPSRRNELARRIEGTVEVPLYLQSARPGAAIRRDASGKPMATTTVRVPFLALVPRTAEESPRPLRLLQFGHGFFGSVAEMELGYLPRFLQDFGFVALGTEWWGMSQADLTTVAADLLNDPSLAIRFTDRVHQAMINFLGLAAAREQLLQLPAFRGPNAPVADPGELYFIGLSQGHILGSTYLTLSPDIERAMVGVGGADFTFIMFRSRAFGLFLGIIAGMFPDPLDQQKMTVLLQTVFDRIDPLTYAPYLVSAPLPRARAKRILMQMGTGDAEVPNLSTELHARAAGIPLALPSAHLVPQLPTVSFPVDGSALAVFHYDIEPFPAIQPIPPTEPNEVHEGQRELRSAQRQVDAFFRPGGLIENFCEGPCDPE